MATWSLQPARAAALLRDEMIGDHRRGGDIGPGPAETDEEGAERHRPIHAGEGDEARPDQSSGDAGKHHRVAAIAVA